MPGNQTDISGRNGRRNENQIAHIDGRKRRRKRESIMATINSFLLFLRLRKKQTFTKSDDRKRVNTWAQSGSERNEMSRFDGFFILGGQR